MSKKTTISVYFNLFSIISTGFLEADTNYLKPKLERNNIINKGLWMRNKLDRQHSNDFIFRANSIDADNVLQNNYDGFSENNVANLPFFSGYIDRSKRSINNKPTPNSRKRMKCMNKAKCPNIEDTLPIITSKFKPTSVFNDYPYEIAVLLNNKKEKKNLSVTELDSYKNDGVQSEDNYRTNTTHIVLTDASESVSPIRKDNLTYTIYSIDETNKTHNKENVSIPKRSMNQHEYESQLIKKIEYTEDINNTAININKLDKDVFDKEDMAWHNAAPPNINVYKILPKKEENIKNKPITERGLIKVLAILTKTFKKIMKQHHDIKKIHNRLNDLNEDFMKNAELLTNKFEEFNAKYLFMFKLNEQLKVMEIKLKEKEQSFNNREKDFTKNLEEFESQQKKFLAQQRQFYNVQKLMLDQNEKINLKQNVIAKTQSEISHRQNNFARILKKAKQIYIDSKNLIPNKLNTALTRPKVKPAKDKVNTLKIISTKTITTTSTLPPPTTESVKINLFSIPALTRLENQDQMILDEKDYQSVDDLIYKYYFNNTFIDDLMKNKILATFIAASDATENNNSKTKRNEIIKLKTTLLVPVNKTIPANGNHRNRRWIKHSKKNVKKTKYTKIENPVVQDLPNIKKNIVSPQPEHFKINKKVDPFITMALSFCKEIGQNLNLQVLNWCVEKALRRLQVIDLQLSPAIAQPVTPTTNPTSHISEDDVGISKTTPTQKLQGNMQQPTTTKAASTVVFFPDNDELENKLKEYELKPDTEGTVYYDGSLHASDIQHIGDVDSEGFSDIMPGLDSNSRVQMDPMAFDLQAQRRANVRKINENIMKMRMV